MYIFNIDRGGTFTDFYVQKVSEDNQIIEQFCFKVPSQSSLGEGPKVGINKFESSKIKKINIGTTIATNALLERKGTKCAVVLSEGFKDTLEIRNQARPNIFDLSCQRPEQLTKNVFTIDSRIYRKEFQISKSLSEVGKDIYHEKPDLVKLQKLKTQIQQLKPESIAISLCNSYLSPQAEDEIQSYLADLQIPIYKGSKYVEMGYLKRTQTAALDSYLDPITKKYFETFASQFENEMEINVMKSDGGFAKASTVKASELLLSGPAGGLIGYSRMSQEIDLLFGLKTNILLGLDMGGTSTDISKSQGSKLPLVYTFPIQGIQICTPHLQIETIAAGGGSELLFQNGMLKVGPGSVGSIPGPVCYGFGEKLAITDANLVLGRLDVKYFPKIFGKNGDMPPDKELSQKVFRDVFQSLPKSTNLESVYCLAEGFIRLANQLMAKSARRLLSSGKADALVVFGSAGGQHCCQIADLIGIPNIIVHKFAGVLSAYGLSLADERKQIKIYLGLEIENGFDFQELLQKISGIKEEDHEKGWTEVIEEVTISYAGTSFSLTMLLSQKMLEQFEQKHREQNGFSLPNKVYKIDYYIKTLIKQPPRYKNNFQIPIQTSSEDHLVSNSQVFLNGRFQNLNKYDVTGMKNCRVQGPALIFSNTASILVQEEWNAHIMNETVHLKKQMKNEAIQIKTKLVEKKIECDPIKLTIFSTRLMGIAQQMGKVLQKTSKSTNIKERLDFSCGIFDKNGYLLANAPHLPVHLGSMETAVRQQIRLGIEPGDVILSNHPNAGGSHLPDLTVISCFWIGEGHRFYVASRGHHADIGGITPGSMPPFSKELSEQGVAVEKFMLIKNGIFLQEQTRELFKCSRRVDDNISDLLAQISSNEFGIKLLKIQAQESTLYEFSSYIDFLYQNSKTSIQSLLVNFSISNNFPEYHSITNQQYMDDGTVLALKLTIDRNEKKAIFDFGGSSQEVIGNTNAPKSITRSAVLYCLRAMLGRDIPLNSGCLEPVKIIIPQNSILFPSPNSAVVGGNVQTSQKLVDLILKPFNIVACSQGTMNNFLFGNQFTSYYETICGGSGAGENFNGVTTQCHMTNTRITDIEYLEKNYPVVLVRFQKRQNSGGRGKNKGGDGVVREIMFLEEMVVSLLSERRVFQPYGIKGGCFGKTGKNLLIRADGIRRNIGGKNLFQVGMGDRVLVCTPGGGGYGKAEQ